MIFAASIVLARCSASELGDLCHQLGFDYYLPGAEKSPSARVFIALGHNDERIFAKFSVSEPAVRAINTKDQDPVYQDSCVEIFVSHPGLNGTCCLLSIFLFTYFISHWNAGQYCNFEFNCIGTCLAAVGSCREARTSLSPSLMSKVIRTSSLGSVPFEEKAINAPWTLDVEIPSEAFMAKAPLSSLTDFRINVYKCGDKV